ncbi:MAG: hypothetical protein ABJB74_11005 [Gemmatimonas sp.]
MCLTCQIIATRTLQLGDDDGPGELSSNPFLSCSATGTFAVTASPAGRPTTIVLYDANGKFRRTLGRSGSGPGEYRTAYPIKFAARDSLYVFDLSVRRLTVLAPDGKYVRTVQMPMRVSAAVLLPNGSTAMFSIMGNTKLPGAPLHIVDANGGVMASFGADNPDQRPIDDATYRFVIARSARGIWAARINDYRISEYDMRGHLLRTLSVPTSWFPKWEADPKRVTPVPGLFAMQEDGAGLLWVMTRVPDKRFRVVPSGTPLLQQPTGDEQFDTVIEVIDTRTNRVLASRTLDETLLAFGCAGTAYAYREDANDRPHVDVWKLSVNGLTSAQKF